MGIQVNPRALSPILNAPPFEASKGGMKVGRTKGPGCLDNQKGPRYLHGKKQGSYRRNYPKGPKDPIIRYLGLGC